MLLCLRCVSSLPSDVSLLWIWWTRVDSWISCARYPAILRQSLEHVSFHLTGAQHQQPPPPANPPPFPPSPPLPALVAVIRGSVCFHVMKTNCSKKMETAALDTLTRRLTPPPPLFFWGTGPGRKVEPRVVGFFQRWWDLVTGLSVCVYMCMSVCVPVCRSHSLWSHNHTCICVGGVREFSSSRGNRQLDAAQRKMWCRFMDSQALQCLEYRCSLVNPSLLLDWLGVFVNRTRSPVEKRTFWFADIVWASESWLIVVLWIKKDCSSWCFSCVL